MVLLGRRRSEIDFNGVFSFFGGKMENTDASIVDAIQREKCEELGQDCQIDLYPEFSTNYLFRKKDGSFMIIPHYYCQFVEGGINLSDEYSEYEWVNVDDLGEFEPKIPTIPDVVSKVLNMSRLIRAGDLVRIH
jgi:8-oxo-dGTP pyrophosphatase MutT (NUDIX family)